MSDIVISKTIPSAKVANFRAGFLRALPNTEMVPNPASTEKNPLPDIPKYTDKEWFIEVIFGYAMREYREGIKLLAQDAIIVDEDIFI